MNVIHRICLPSTLLQMCILALSSNNSIRGTYGPYKPWVTKIWEASLEASHSRSSLATHKQQNSREPMHHRVGKLVVKRRSSLSLSYMAVTSMLEIKQHAHSAHGNPVEPINLPEVQHEEKIPRSKIQSWSEICTPGLKFSISIEIFHPGVKFSIPIENFTPRSIARNFQYFWSRSNFFNPRALWVVISVTDMDFNSFELVWKEFRYKRYFLWRTGVPDEWGKFRVAPRTPCVPYSGICASWSHPGPQAQAPLKVACLRGFASWAPPPPPFSCSLHGMRRWTWGAQLEVGFGEGDGTKSIRRSYRVICVSL